MIRQANKFDFPDIWDLMVEFRNQTTEKFLHDIENKPYLENVMARIMAGAGIIYIAPNKGLIAGVIAPSFWCDKTLLLQEICWYVKPEYRNTTIGYRLLKAYIEKAKQFKEEKRIAAFTIAKMNISPNIKYEKFGFSKLEEIWVQ